MKRVAPGPPRDLHELIDPQIALARGRRPDRIGFVGHAYVQAGAIRFAVNGNAGDFQLAAGAQNAYCDLAAIGNE